MAFEAIRINNMYSLHKEIKSGKWTIGMWVNETLYARDGTNRKLGKKKDKTSYRFFREIIIHESRVQLTLGDRVNAESEKGVVELFYVVDQITTKDGSYKYYIGI